jgi:hypothetical protein
MVLVRRRGKTMMGTMMVVEEVVVLTDASGLGVGNKDDEGMWSVTG